MQRWSMNDFKIITESDRNEMLSKLKTTEENEREKGKKQMTISEFTEKIQLSNKGNVKRSRIVYNRKKAVKRSAHSGGKRKKSLKHEPKEDGFGKGIYKPRFYRLPEPVIPTEIPMPRLKELAAKLLDCYNKIEGLDFELVEVVKGFTDVRDDISWHHLNFKAKLKDPQSDVKLFFGEVMNEEMPICCIIDPNDFRKVCDFCDVKEQVRHPLYPTGSMSSPAASSEIHYEPPTCSSVYEIELIKAGGSEKKAKKAYKDFLYRTYECWGGV